MKQLKIYTPGPRHFVTNEIARAIGLGQYRSQADVYVAAYTKAEAFQFLADLDLAPSSVSDKEFRVAMGNTVEALIAYGVLPYAGAVAVTRPSGTNSPVVRAAETGCTPVGEFVRGKFVPGADLVADGGLTAAPITEADVATATAGLAARCDPSYPEEAEMLLAQLDSSSRRIPQVEAELNRLRDERNMLCLRAYELGLVDQAAGELGVTPARVYQYKDKALRARANEGDYRPGLKVEVEDPNLPPSKFQLAVVVPKPADAVAPGGAADTWVWVRYDLNQAVVPIRKHRVRAAVPSCSICEPADAPYGLTRIQLNMHQASKHGVRS